jgi:hypothetical protein
VRHAARAQSALVTLERRKGILKVHNEDIA